MRPHLVAVPVAMALMLLAVVLGTLRLLLLQGLAATPLGFLQIHHGELVVFGFLAPLLLTERYLGASGFSLHPSIRTMPFLVVAGALLKLAAWLGGLVLLNILGSVTIAAATLLYIYLLYSIGRQTAQSLPFQYLILGAVVLLAGALINITRSPVVNPAFTLLLISFPVFTILGERVELSRFLSPGAYQRARWGLWIAVAASVLLLLRILVVDSGYLVTAWAVLLGITAAFLVRPELTLVKLGKTGLHRYLGRHLTIAYIWFFLGLVILAVVRERYPLYDAGTHALAIGFVFTMIIAHAPVIAPVIVRRVVVEERLSYYPVILLTVGVTMRVGGYLLEAAGVDIPALTGVSGAVALLAIILFFPMLLRSLRPA